MTPNIIGFGEYHSRPSNCDQETQTCNGTNEILCISYSFNSPWLLRGVGHISSLKSLRAVSDCALKHVASKILPDQGVTRGKSLEEAAALAWKSQPLSLFRTIQATQTTKKGWKMRLPHSIKLEGRNKFWRTTDIFHKVTDRD